jgi:hypothetical protein
VRICPKVCGPISTCTGVRYTNDALAASTQLVGRKLLLYLNADDLRSVRAFLPDGTELGVLKCARRMGSDAT